MYSIQAVHPLPYPLLGVEPKKEAQPIFWWAIVCKKKVVSTVERPPEIFILQNTPNIGLDELVMDYGIHWASQIHLMRAPHMKIPKKMGF
jgi:hypothetical protein